ncbi:hypothetical protein G3436_25970, partial [Pseudomonas sp. MAFF212427]
MHTIVGLTPQASPLAQAIRRNRLGLCLAALGALPLMPAMAAEAPPACSEAPTLKAVTVTATRRE